MAYRTVSLLLKRPPGREAYPGDVFYLHSRLLERACKLSATYGGGSLTALPIIETQAGDISAYIPTNVISITDGQIFLQQDLFNSGFRPAIDTGLSVSRVGSAAQVKAMKQVASQLKFELAQYAEMQSFAQFGSDLDKATQAIIDHGQRVRALLIQPQYESRSLVNQILMLFSLKYGFVKEIPVAGIANYMQAMLDAMHAQHANLVEMLASEKEITPALETALKESLQAFTTQYLKTVA